MQLNSVCILPGSTHWTGEGDGWTLCCTSSIFLLFSNHRKQFGRPLAANQLIQKKLADMLTEVYILHQTKWLPFYSGFQPSCCRLQYQLLHKQQKASLKAHLVTKATKVFSTDIHRPSSLSASRKTKGQGTVSLSLVPRPPHFYLPFAFIIIRGSGGIVSTKTVGTVLPCIIVNANGRLKAGEAWKRG